MRHGIPKPIIYRGVRYPSHQALAEAYGIGYEMAQTRLRRGQPLDMPYCGGSLKGGKKVAIGGITYPTMTAAAKALGVSVSTVWKRYHCQERIDAPVRKTRKPCLLDGRKYPTLTICADFLGVSLYKAKKIVDECGRWL